MTTTFFRALGYSSDADVLKLFYDIEELTVKAAENQSGRPPTVTGTDMGCGAGL